MQPLFGRSRPAADASRDVAERWLLDSLDVSVVTGGVPVTHLRKMMLDELQLRNYAQNTMRHYVHTVEDFARRLASWPTANAPSFCHFAFACSAPHHSRKLNHTPPAPTPRHLGAAPNAVDR